MATVEELRLEIKAQVADAVSKLRQYDRATEKTSAKTKTMMDRFRSMQAVMQGPVAAFNMISGAVGKAVAQFDKLIMSAAEGEEKQALLNAALKATGATAWTSASQLNDYANTMASLTLFENEAITGMQGVLLGFRNIQGVNFDKASTEILNMAQFMKMDLTSAAQAVGKALDSPVTGMDSLSKQGFKFTKQEKELIKSLVETNRLADAQDIILKELTRTYGGAAEAAAATATGTYRNMKKAFGDFNEEIGKQLADSFAPVFKFYAEGIPKVTKALSDAAKKEKMGDLLSPLLTSRTNITKLENDMAKASITWGDSVEYLTGKYQALQTKKNAIGNLGGKELDNEINQTLSLLSFARDRASAEATIAKELKRQADINAKSAEAQKAIDDFNAKRTVIEKSYSDAVENANMLESMGSYSRDEANKKRKTALDAEIEALATLIQTDPNSPSAIALLEKRIELQGKLNTLLLEADVEKKDKEDTAKQEIDAAEWMKNYLIDVDNEVTKIKIENAEKAAKAQVEAYQIVKDSAMDVWGSVNDLIENNNDAYLANLEAQGVGEEELKKEKNRIGREEFDSKKLTSLANIAINTAEGAIKAMTIDPTGILAGVVTAAGVAAGVTAAAQQYVPMAEGGIVKGGRGGIHALIGEKSYDEAVIPLKNGKGLGYTVVNNFSFNGSPWAIKEAEAVAVSAIQKASRGY